MNGFILGFQRLVWCPKWTPDSNNSFTPMLNTIFLWLKIRSARRRRTIPRNTGLSLMLLWPASALLRRGKPHSLERENQGRFPLPTDSSASGKGLMRIANSRVMAIAIFGWNRTQFFIIPAESAERLAAR
jgi:hypothetical protein